MADRNNSIYINPHASIFMVVGTGGADQYDFWTSHHILLLNLRGLVFLNIGILDNGTRMAGTFFDNRDGNGKDHFTIIKK